MKKIHKKTENKTKDFININSKEHKKTDVVWKKNVINKIKHKIQSLSNKIELNLLFKHFLFLYTRCESCLSLIQFSYFINKFCNAFK